MRGHLKKLYLPYLADAALHDVGWPRRSTIFSAAPRETGWPGLLGTTGAAQLRPNEDSTRGRSVTGLWTTDLQSCGQLRPNGTGTLRQRNTALSDQVRFYCFAQHAVTRRRCYYWIMLQF